MSISSVRPELDGGSSHCSANHPAEFFQVGGVGNVLRREPAAPGHGDGIPDVCERGEVMRIGVEDENAFVLFCLHNELVIQV